MSSTIAAPKGTPAAVASAAKVASEKLAGVIQSAGAASGAAYATAYGADVTPASVKLAKRAADELAGLSKSKGGARADVLAVLATLADRPAREVTPAAFVAAARVRMDENARAVKDRRDRKRALADTVNDSAATISQRAAALDVLAGMDAADSDAKGKQLLATFAAHVDKLAAHGIPADVLAELVATRYGVELSVNYPAAVPADVATIGTPAAA